LLTMDRRVSSNSRYAVGIFTGGLELSRAYKELVANDFAVSKLCLMAPGSVVAAYLGTGSLLTRRNSDLSEEDTRSLRELMATLRASGAFCVAGPVHVSDGTICTLVGQDDNPSVKGKWFSDVLGAWIARRSAQYLEDRLGEGKILIWVQTGDRTGSKREHLACDILLHHASESVRVLDFAAIR
jgi:hypothetical protein